MSNYKIETKCIQSGYEPGNGDVEISAHILKEYKKRQ